MKDVFRKKSVLQIVSPLCVSLATLQAAESNVKQPSAHTHITSVDQGPGYTINFNNVSILEYVRFISKISGKNFIFKEEDLSFTVSIVSEEPTDLNSVLAALVQVLRINGLTLLDDGTNLIINQSTDVKQISPVVSAEHPLDGQAPVTVTRLFRIKNGNPANIAALFRPLMSAEAIIEVSSETRHIILTDITANVDRAADLLLTLDAPFSALEFGTYTAKNALAENLVLLATQILSPISEGNPLIFVPQTETNNVFIISTPFLVEKSKAIFIELDALPSTNAHVVLNSDNILFYKIKFKTPDAIESALDQIASSLEQLGYAPEGFVKSIASARYIKETQSLLFTGSPTVLTKVQEVLGTIDIQGKPVWGSQNASFLLYRAMNRSPQDISSILAQISKNLEDTNLADANLLSTIAGVKIINSTHSLLFTGDQESLNDIKTMLTGIDVQSDAQIEQMGKKFYIYKIQNTTEEHIAKALSNLAEDLEDSGYPDHDLIEAIDNMKWIKESNSLVFTGQDATIKKLTEILTSFDVTSSNALPESGEFLLYTPKSKSPEEILSAVKEVSKNLVDSGLSDPAFLNALDSAKWVPSSHAIIFTGDEDSLKRIQSLLASMDIAKGHVEKSTTFIYNVKYVPPSVIEKGLQNIATNLPDNDDVVTTIDSMRYATDSNSFIFNGSPASIERIKELLAVIDSTKQAQVTASAQNTFYLYKLKNVSGGVIIQDLNNVAKNLKASGIDNHNVVDAINSLEWIKTTNSIYISGTPDAIETIKNLIIEFDIARAQEAPSTFFIYKPKFKSVQEIADSVESIAEELQNAGVNDPDLLASLRSMRQETTTSSVIFSGTAVTLDRIKEMVANIDIPSTKGSIQHIGQVTFLIYKLKAANAPQFLSSLKSVAQDLESAGSADKDLIRTLSNARYVAETNSVVFTGTDASLEKVQALAEKFDSANLAADSTKMTPEGYVIYKPKFVSGPDLIQFLQDFERSLTQSGIQEPALFSAIANLKWMDKTTSLLITGDQASIEKIQELLERFDIQGAGTSGTEPAIETIEDVSFLIYKLQYHQGTEIEDALQKIATDLTTARGAEKGNEKGSGLIQAIKSIQWLQVTNSLIGTGDVQTLSKLKELIRNIDVPPKQVFIEVLVIRTDLANTLNFGLRWGTQGKYRNKLGFATGSFPQFTDTTDPLGVFNSTLQGVNATTTPSGNNIPFTQGFGLGVIGDIIFHKGTSYAGLGSLVDALRQDADTTIVLSQKIITQDNKQSTIFVGDNIPFTGSVVTTTAAINQQTASNLEYRDIGVSLSITPRVGDDDIVSLVIDEEISEEESSGDTTSTSSVTGIRTSKTSMQTQASVPDQHFLVLSGMMRNEKDRIKTSIPCLGGIPIIGAAFTRNDIGKEKKNVIIFVRPQIIKSFDIYKQITDHQEQLFRGQSVAEDYDEGLDLVKTPEDEQ